MIYKLQRHKEDTAMIEATGEWTSSLGKVNTFLAFIVHEDCIEDPNIKDELENAVEVIVELKLKGT